MKTKNGFTLIELLIVIAVIAILAAILLPTLASAKKHAYMMNCTSNMKQIGQAVTLFADDHRDVLPPGPSEELPAGSPTGLGTGQEEVYSTVTPHSSQQLLYSVATYLGAPEPKEELQTCKTFECPAAFLANPNMANITNDLFYCVIAASDSFTAALPGLPWNPFGHASAGGVHKLAEIRPAIWSGRMPWMLTDCDRWGLDLPPPPNPSPWGLEICATPPHAKVRNFVFFDGHVDHKLAIQKPADYPDGKWSLSDQF